MNIKSDEYEISYFPEQPGMLQIVNTTTQQSLHVTIEEAIALLKVMLDHRDELRSLRLGDN